MKKNLQRAPNETTHLYNGLNKLNNKTILIIDDDKALSLLARLVLEKDNYDIHQARSGEQALELLHSLQPSAILLDVCMPGMDGFETCKSIRKDRNNSHVPIMMITGQDDTDSVDRAYECGATDFSSKPVNWTILRQRLKFMLKASEVICLLGEKESSLRSLVLAMPDQILRVNARGSVVEFDCGPGYKSDKYQQMALLAAHTEVLKNNLSIIEHVLSRGEKRIIEKSVILESNEHRLEYRLVKENDNQVVIVIRDVSDLHSAKKRLYNLAYYNRVTELPNKYYVEEVLADRYKNGIENLAVVRVQLTELDSLKNTIGKELFDQLLMQVTQRLKDYIGGYDIEKYADLTDIYKLDGPEFAVMFFENGGIHNLGNKVSEIIELVSAPFYINEYELQVTPGIGAVLSEQGDDFESVLSKAGEARKLAHISDRDQSYIYRPDMTVKAKRKITIMGELRKAIEKDELELYYQPQINLINNKITGLEALLRWNSSAYGSVSPAEFIPLAEESGLIVPIGDFVIDKACQQAAQWQQAGYRTIRVAVNMSAKQVHRRNLVNYIKDCLDKYRLNPSGFEIELTETALAQDIGITTELLHHLKDVGVRTAIDDFGTGYSSLSYLSQLPFDVLKIDRSFIQSLDGVKSSSRLVEAIISMGKGLNLEVLAEGVETNQQKQYLGNNFCDTIQGYLFSKPQSASNIEALFNGNMP